MPEELSWRGFLKQIVKTPIEYERLACEVKVHPATLRRWITGDVMPRVQNFYAILQALPNAQQSTFTALLAREGIQLYPVEAPQSEDQLDYAFIRKVLEVCAHTSSHLLFWTLCHQIFQHALRLLDPVDIGLAIRVVQCMPPMHDGKIHSLRESLGAGTHPLQQSLHGEAVFLGAESLAGFAVAGCRQEVVHDLREHGVLPSFAQREYEVSAVASPILHANSIAGCLVVLSAQPDHFATPGRLELVNDYARLVALAFAPEQFYPLECIELRAMPAPIVQRKYMSTFRQRVVALVKESSRYSRTLSHADAEQIAWQQLEEELIEAFHDSLQRR